MAITLRQGAYTDLDATKLLTAELAVVTSGHPTNATTPQIYKDEVSGDGTALYLQTSKVDSEKSKHCHRIAYYKDIASYVDTKFKEVDPDDLRKNIEELKEAISSGSAIFSLPVNYDTSTAPSDYTKGMSLLNFLGTTVKKSQYIPSYVGEVVTNTKSTLSQMRAIYGTSTTWKMIDPRGRLEQTKVSCLNSDTNNTYTPEVDGIFHYKVVTNNTPGTMCHIYLDDTTTNREILNTNYNPSSSTGGDYYAGDVELKAGHTYKIQLPNIYNADGNCFYPYTNVETDKPISKGLSEVTNNTYMWVRTV